MSKQPDQERMTLELQVNALIGEFIGPVVEAVLNGVGATELAAAGTRKMAAFIEQRCLEARIDEHNLYHKEVEECDSEGTPGVDDLIERGYLEQYHDERIAQLTNLQNKEDK